MGSLRSRQKGGSSRADLSATESFTIAASPLLQAINDLRALFPPQLATLRRVQWALPHAQHK